MRKLTLFAFLLSLCLSFGAAQAQMTTECAPGFRLFEHEYLATAPLCIPEHPQRIVAIDDFSLETLVALDILPVASSDIGPFLIEHPHMSEQLASVVSAGLPPNPETLLGLQPDLIIGIEPRIADVYEALAAIAPTVSFSFNSSAEWREITQAVGEVINQPEALQAAFDVFDARVETFRNAMTVQSTGDVSVIFLYPEWTRLYLSGSFLGTILDAAGLTFPQKQYEAAGDVTFALNVSKEQLDLLDSSDHIFIWMYATNDEEAAANDELLAAFTSDPLWLSLPAVQADKVYVVGGYWIGSSLISAHAVLDDLFVHLAGVNPAEVSPDPFLAVTPEATAEAAS